MIGKILDYIEYKYLFKLRLLSKSICIQIESQLKDFTDCRKKCQELLYYDESIYDSHTYSRKLLKQNLASKKADYINNLFIPTIKKYKDDLSSESNIVSIPCNIKMPMEICMFLMQYFETPDVEVDICNNSLIKTISNNQTSYLWKQIEKNNVNDIMLFTPICYSKHHGRITKNKKVIRTMLFVNIVGDQLESIPDIEDRYITKDIVVNNIDDTEEYSNKITVLIEQIIHEDNKTSLIQEMSSLYDACKKVKENYCGLY